MFVVNEKEKEFRHGNHGPKYLMEGPLSKFGIVQLLPHEEVSGHYHKIMEENFYVAEGKVEFTVDGEKIALEQGEFLHLDPGESHVITNVSDEMARIFISLSPALADDKYPID